MEKKSNTATPPNRRKALLVLPLLAIPFLTLLFWALGGGSGNQLAEAPALKGINLNLPQPKLPDDKSLDKMGYYQRAAADSVKKSDLRVKERDLGFKERLKPYTIQQDNPQPGLRGLEQSDHSSRENQLNDKLKKLEQAISAPSKNPTGRVVSGVNVRPEPTSSNTAEIQKLEAMMASMSAPAEADPEMAQISGMLENILDIQHPERVQQRLKARDDQRKGQALTVVTEDTSLQVSTLAAPNAHASFMVTAASHNGFYGLENADEARYQANAIEAVVQETQTIVNGAVVKFRLLDAITVQGTTVPAGSFLFGIASLKGERLSVNIESLRVQESLFPVALAVYDLDGMEGLYIPGAISRDVAKASADRSAQTLGVATLDDSWGAQATGAGIEAAKSLFSKKVKLVKVTLKAGYKVLLKDDKPKNTK